ncbi:unnamed protein product [Cylicocyclus nassatus]|uniref:Uncharacterized protein n=1 Tax=Cylicocyclus nassatus TaxID=53992 RepID=A0AA36GSA9_CYLNA|nr:unnamed protein product [Cylicocyclus nassatus]
METQSDNLKALLGVIARTEALGKTESSCEGVRDIEKLRIRLPDGTRPRPKHTFTDNMKVQIYELKKSQSEKGSNSSTIKSGAAVMTPHEIAFTSRDVYMREETAKVELSLDERICIYPGQKFTICQNGSVRKGYIIQALPSNTEKTLAEKLIEDCEFITGENLAVLIPREILAKLEAEPDSSHPDSDNVQSNV